MVGAAAQLGDVLDRGDPSVAHDRDRVAHALDLVEVVGGQEDRASAVAVLADHRHELLLHQRIKPGRRLVEHQQLRVVEQRLDQPDLLPVPAGQITHPTAEVSFETLRQTGPDPRSSMPRAAAQNSRNSRPVSRGSQ